MLTGDPVAAEDLLQVAFALVWPKWDRIRHEAPDAYVRKTMLRAHLRGRQRRWHAETPTETLRDGIHTVDFRSDIDQQRVLVEALRHLPVRQRQAVVLRFADDLSVDTVADLMGCTPGTVKSQTAKGLTKLRAALQDIEQDEVEQR
jgi:RNA polymerase sigma-70 factor (sigma-E family)